MYQPLRPFGKDTTKVQVVDNTPMRIDSLDFSSMSPEEIQKQSQLEICDRNLYNLDVSRTPTTNGPLDRRLGTSSKATQCETCFHDQKLCNGHWGYVRLEAACFHIGYLAYTIDVLNSICKTCSRVLLSDKSRQNNLKTLRKPTTDSFQRKALLKRLQAECKKTRRCPHCDASNGPVRKVAGHACKLVHLKFEFFHKSTAKSKKPPPDKVLFDHAMETYCQANPDNTRHTRKAVDDLPAVKVHRLFCRIPTEDCELLGLNPDKGRPESYLWTYLPVPPSNIRPSVPGDQGTTEDELTTKLSEIIDLNTRLKMAVDRDEHMSIQMDYYEKLQDHIAMYINSHAPGLNKSEYGKAIRSFCSRLKGKQGRFRGNLSGKRVNYSGRTVISPDPNLSVEEVGIPIHVAKILSYPESVTQFNIQQLREAIKTGADNYPGANHIRKKYTGHQISIKIVQALGDDKHHKAANELRVGDIVHRHLINGDIVLFNRQPSLHKLSILCHKVRVHDGRTFRFNESVCIPYNADFDGDEMNIHVPQTEEARAEAQELMGVKHNLVTPKNGAPIIAPIQDFITGAYLLSKKDRFFTKFQFSQIIGWMFDATGFQDPETEEHQGYDLPPPTIYKPMYLWTGKQVFNVLMRPSKKCKVMVNVEATLREFKPVKGQPLAEDENDAYLIIRNSEIMCGVMDKNAIGDGKKTSVFFVILRDYGEDYAVAAMNRMAKVASRWLTQQGFSMGVGDVYPSKELEAKKQRLIDKAYTTTTELIDDFKKGRLTRYPGCTEEQTLETKISKILSDVRNDAGAACFEELSRHNAAVIMAKSGSKGSMINVSQMTAGVGQQMISQKRVENGFQDRTLPHFAKGSRDPASKGFVSNSFFSGLTPTEFIFHAMSGREGLVDTAVKTAETGYMSRRLIKSLEDAYVVYDNTVRNSTGSIIQFSFGDDFLDPAHLEGNKQPLNFERTFSHAIESTRHADHTELSPHHIREQARKYLDGQRSKLLRTILSERPDDAHRERFDTHQAIEKFLNDVEGFIGKQAGRIEQLLLRKRIDVQVDHNTSRKGRASNTQPRITKQPLSEKENRRVTSNILSVTQLALDEFLKLCIHKYQKAIAQPGHAVGAIAAQSIGEPGTQMTLKTFHFAGVAGMSITQGVPRIKEIINAAKKISTPVITCTLENKYSEQVAQIVKARIEKTYLHDIAEYVEDTWSRGGGVIRLRIDIARIEKLELELTLNDISNKISSTKGLKVERQNITHSANHIKIRPNELNIEAPDEIDLDGASDDEDKSGRGRKKKKTTSYFQTMQDLKRSIINVVVKGYPDTNRAIIRKSDAPDDAGKEQLELLVEGYGLKQCMGTEGVDGTKTKTNSVMETANVLGIEAARSVIISEIQHVMESMDIDNHHIHLLACIMTLKGEVLGITRFGMVKMGDSVLQLASFEKTPDHLFEAATKMKSDPILGVSESIIMGQTVKLGTGATSVIRLLDMSREDMVRRVPVFSTSYKAGRPPKRSAEQAEAWSQIGQSVDVDMEDLQA